MPAAISELPMEQIAAFCRKWKIVRLALFGSALRDDFGPDSDLDLLATFAADARWTLFEHFRMENELVELVGREVDLVDREAVESNPNWLRRKEILSTARTIYAA